MVENAAKGASENGLAFEVDAEIAFILEHPGMSEWLKSALREALRRDPIAVLNDLEILNLILRSRAQELLSGLFA